MWLLLCGRVYGALVEFVLTKFCVHLCLWHIDKLFTKDGPHAGLVLQT